MSRKAISKDTSKAANNYFNVKVSDEYCVSMTNIVKKKEIRTNQDIVTSALKEYFENHYEVIRKDET